jgi:hypothetical protein
VFEEPRRAVDAVLPGAYCRAMVVRRRCGDLPDLRGRLVVVFVRVTGPTLPFLLDRPETPTLVVHTARQEADIDLTDA